MMGICHELHVITNESVVDEREQLESSWPSIEKNIDPIDIVLTAIYLMDQRIS